jgi:hypothetical protein
VYSFAGGDLRPKAIGASLIADGAMAEEQFWCRKRDVGLLGHVSEPAITAA